MISDMKGEVKRLQDEISYIEKQLKDVDKMILEPYEVKLYKEYWKNRIKKTKEALNELNNWNSIK